MNDFLVDALVFSPHPDDAEIFLGGTIAKMTQAGKKVIIADLTQGELSTGGSVESRQQESAAAAAVLQLHDRVNLALPDGRISAGGTDEFGQQQVSALVALLRERRPQVVFAPSAQSRHPDHSATNALVERAVFFAGVKKFAADAKGKKFSPVQVVYYQMRFLERPSFVVDTTDTHQIKRDAISCYQTQIQAQTDAPEDKTLLNAVDTVSSISTRDAFYGSMIGSEYGEPFVCKTIARVNDPLEYCHAHATPRAQFFWGDS